MSDFYVQLLGTGSPKPNIDRFGPSQYIQVGDTPILVDCGEGTTNQLLNAGVNPVDVEHILFTHLHSDHVFGYSHLLLGGWSLGRDTLTIVGPKGLKKFHESIIAMFEEDINYRVNVLGISSKGLLDVNIIELPEDGGEISIGVDNVTITAAPVIHNVKTFGFRFDYKEKSIVISGDTAPIDSLVQLSNNADVLVIDAAIAPSVFNNPSSDPNIIKIKELLAKEHCSPKQAGQVGTDANVKKLVLTHLLPNTDVNEVYEDTQSTFKEEIIVGEDLLKITP